MIRGRGVWLVGLFVGTACGTAGFERGLAATVTHDGHPGIRGAIGMPRGEEATWATQLTAIGELDGFFAVAGGVSTRAPVGFSTRVTGSFGIGTFARSSQADANGKGGIGPYGELLAGVDLPIADHGATALTILAGGTFFLNGNESIPRGMLVVGITWK